MNTNPNENYKYIHHAFGRACDTALHLLQKANDFVKDKNIDENEILQAKLASDMFDFKKQIQVFTDNVAGGLARPLGLEKLSLPDTETTIVELIARTQKVKDFIATIKPENVTGVETAKIKLGWMPEGVYFDAHGYLGDFVVQNTLFHLVIAYAILRHKGVQVGKMDFIGSIDFKKE